MVFPVQPSKKKKTTIGRRQKQGNSRAAHQNALDAAVADGVTENELDSRVTPLPTAASSTSASKNRKDANWRSNRAVKSAKRATAKAIAERDAGREDNILTKGKLNTAISRVKQVEHEQ